MKNYRSINYRSELPCSVALGCFDGVHLGHAEVIRAAREKADALGCPCAVWTFDQPPKNFFLKEPVPILTDSEEKKKIMSLLGVDLLVSVPFTSETANISAEDFFLTVIKDRLKSAHVVCGFDYSFGAHGIGNVALLQKLCKKHGIGLTVIPPVSIGGITVSSSVIRESLGKGDIETANQLLGRPYAISSVVINGQHLARHLGFPTLNQELSKGLAVPKYGVYLTRVDIDGVEQEHFGVTNVGIRPTVGGSTLFSETHILDFSGDLYGRSVRVEFLKFIRPEERFDSLEALTHQVNGDIEEARRLSSTNN